MGSLRLALLLATCTILLDKCLAQNNINGIFQDIPLSSQYYPTSGVSVATNTGDSYDIFYRGPKYQLLHAVLTSSGVIQYTEDLGGTLLSAPSAVSTSSGSFVVSYVTLLQRVVYRTSSSSSWSGEKFAKIRSVNPPAAVFIPNTGDETVKLYVTAVNSELNEVEIKNGDASNPSRFGVFSPGAPAALYTYSEEGTLIFTKDKSNDVFSWSSEAGGPFERRRDVPKLSSGFCAANIGEGGLLILGRGFYRNVEPIFSFPGGGGSRRRWDSAPWISDAPGCLFGPHSCTVIVVTSGPKMSFSQYCN